MFNVKCNQIDFPFKNYHFKIFFFSFTKYEFYTMRIFLRFVAILPRHLALKWRKLNNIKSYFKKSNKIFSTLSFKSVSPCGLLFVFCNFSYTAIGITVLLVILMMIGMGVVCLRVVNLQKKYHCNRKYFILIIVFLFI